MPVDDSLNGTVRLDGDDFMDAENAGTRLEQAAYGGDDGHVLFLLLVILILFAARDTAASACGA